MKNRNIKPRKEIFFFIFCLALASMVLGQFISRYPLLKGYRNHTYFEGYDMPILGTGPTDPVAAPDGRFLIFSARGWLWRYDLQSSEARQLTWGGACDFRPALSPAGSSLAFVRDDSKTSKIMLLDLASNTEKVLVNSGLIDLDPAFAQDGKTLYYSSSATGDLDLWKIDIASGQKTRITEETGLEMRPLPLPDGQKLVYVSKTRGGNDALRLLDLASGKWEPLLAGSILSQLRPALSPDGRVLAVNLPDSGHYQFYQLWLYDLQNPTLPVNLTYDLKLPLMPAWSSDQKSIYFVEADARQHLQLKQMPSAGGSLQTLTIKKWHWQTPMARVVIQTASAGASGLVPARLHVNDGQGHPLFAEEANARFDSQSGLAYFHSPGKVELEVPAGQIKVLATHGFAAPAVQVIRSVPAQQTLTIDLQFQQLWNPRSQGWYCGDNHFHLNYGGSYYLTPEDLLPFMRGEDLDVAVPMTANLHNRNMDMEWINWQRSELPAIVFGQEVRSHFLGHVGLFNIREWFWPWYYGPGYPLYARQDIVNADPLLHARRQQGISTYVHPIYAGSPFQQDNLAATPPNLIPDALLGNMDTMEIACAWINALGTWDLWYRLLNLGLAISPNAGSDTFPNYYRDMVFGCDRIYVHIDGPFTWGKYLAALRQGRSFVSTGPLLDFQVAGQEAGGVLQQSGQNIPWQLDLYSPVPVKQVEIVVNGQIALVKKGLSKPGKISYKGTIALPVNGWIAARAHGGEHLWPVMDALPLAHTAPIWLTEKGSRDQVTARAAAADLLRVLENAEQRVNKAYGEAAVPRIKAQFAAARQLLEKLRSE